MVPQDFCTALGFLKKIIKQPEFLISPPFEMSFFHSLFHQAWHYYATSVNIK